VLRRRTDAAAIPDVEAEVVVVAAGGRERGRAQVGLRFEADDPAVEGSLRFRVAASTNHTYKGGLATTPDGRSPALQAGLGVMWTSVYVDAVAGGVGVGDR
jgi:hypothetical protein